MGRIGRIGRRGWAAVVVSALMLLAVAAVCPGQTERALGASVLTDLRTAEVRGEWTWPGGLVTTGPVVSWNKEQPDHVWGGGVFGKLTVTPEGTIPLRNLIPGLGEWLQLPETVAVRIDFGAQLQVVNVAHGPDLAGAPFVEIGVGPVAFNARWQIAEGGAIEDLMKSRPALFIGLRPIWIK